MLINLPLRRLSHKRFASAVIISISVFYLFLSNQSIISLDIFDESLTLVSEDPPGSWRDHPVVLLHERAQKEFNTLVSRQSRSPDDAETEYIRRYGRKPPPGFRQWVEYALSHDSPIIDDFDMIASGVHRFFHLTATEIAHRMRNATQQGPGKDNNDGIDRCVFMKGRFSQGCRKFAEPLTHLLGTARQLVPNVEFLLNFLDEPSVLQGQQEQAASSVSTWMDLSHRSITAAVAEACGLQGNSTPAANANEPFQTYGIPFVQDTGKAKDLCQHPEYGSLHGFLMCPATFRRIKTETPILSQAAPYPFSDILFPSTHYGLRSSLYKQSEDRAWGRKKNAVYWAGSSTGGHWSQDTWRQGHRQRLVTLGSHKVERNFTYLRTSAESTGQLEPYVTSAWDGSLFDIALTKNVGCDTDAVCEEQRHFFGTSESVDPESRPFKYRFVLDIDGNSYSGRFYRFLASRSVPLKVSVFHEWHDERLIPWLHYVPVSQSMEELPELMRFLATTAKGQEISWQIAKAGREWYFKALSPVHQGIYLYRLLLELAWMQHEERPVD